jgi:hypothetical protein
MFSSTVRSLSSLVTAVTSQMITMQLLLSQLLASFFFASGVAADAEPRDLEAQWPADAAPLLDGSRFPAPAHVGELFREFFAALVGDLSKLVEPKKIKKPYIETFMQDVLLYQNEKFLARMQAANLAAVTPSSKQVVYLTPFAYLEPPHIRAKPKKENFFCGNPMSIV